MQEAWLLAIFIAGWFLVSGLLAHIGGWASLARDFAAGAPDAGERYRFISGSVGHRFFPVHYRGCLFLTITREGLHLSVLFLFRFQTPPLLIPWQLVESMAEERQFFTRYTIITLRSRWQHIRLRGEVGDSVRAAYAMQRG
jgi:hypothetical protein